MLEAAARSAGIVDLLDCILSVEEVKIFKPSPRVYHLAPEHLRRAPGRARLRVLELLGRGRGRLGRSQTFWIQRRAAEPPEELGFTADHTVAPSPIFPRSLRG